MQRSKQHIHHIKDFLLMLTAFYRTTVEQLHNEINALDARIKKVKKQIELPTTEIEIKHQMIDFLQVSTLNSCR